MWSVGRRSWMRSGRAACGAREKAPNYSSPVARNRLSSRDRTQSAHVVSGPCPARSRPGRRREAPVDLLRSGQARTAARCAWLASARGPERGIRVGQPRFLREPSRLDAPARSSLCSAIRAPVGSESLPESRLRRQETSGRLDGPTAVGRKARGSVLRVSPLHSGALMPPADSPGARRSRAPVGGRRTPVRCRAGPGSRRRRAFPRRRPAA